MIYASHLQYVRRNWYRKFIHSLKIPSEYIAAKAKSTIETSVLSVFLTDIFRLFSDEFERIYADDSDAELLRKLDVNVPIKITTHGYNHNNDSMSYRIIYLNWFNEPR